MKGLTVGILAHVDAGKTTLVESLLYAAGKLDKPGRVDHGNAFLDSHALEKERGITIFSQVATLDLPSGGKLTLLDTPGHVDFAAEMERALDILDYAVLVISGSEGVQAHTETLWRLLNAYHLPVFLFVTKMDMAQRSKGQLLQELKERLDMACVDMGETEALIQEEMALLDETMLNHYVETGELPLALQRQMIRTRKAFPVYFGSGLQQEGIGEFLSGLERYTMAREWSQGFGAKVYKISRTPQGNRLTYLKLTGGKLRVRTPLRYHPPGEESPWLEERITEIRLYSGEKYQVTEEVSAGELCAVVGLSKTYVGQGLGVEPESRPPMLTPFLVYGLSFPLGTDLRQAYGALKQVEEEDPALHVFWQEKSRQIQVQLMGEVQMEILRSLLWERFQLAVEPDQGHILYGETIAQEVEGVGHFEPLRHYAEVHLLLTPLPRGSGLQFASVCSEDVLEGHWQRLILSHLQEKPLLGVLANSPLMDMKITLLTGRAHLKHTEGGDFRQATFRALRQGLMQAESILLEPWYAFRLGVSGEHIGRAISDIRAMSGEFVGPEEEGGLLVLRGRAPAREMQHYAQQVTAYTHGQGQFSYCLDGYAPCHHSAAVQKEIAYDPLQDRENPADSVFCAHGSGVIIPWDQVREHMHVDSGWRPPEEKTAPLPKLRPRVQEKNLDLEEKELEQIMLREFGPIKRPLYGEVKQKEEEAQFTYAPKKDVLLIDGYNVIYAWPTLKEMAQTDLDGARKKLMDRLDNYQAYTQSHMVLVFDAYHVPGNQQTTFSHHGVQVVFTKERETADALIERLLQDIGQNYGVRVVTSDGLIQLAAVRKGVLRVSAREFEQEVCRVEEEIRRNLP